MAMGPDVPPSMEAQPTYKDKAFRGEAFELLFQAQRLLQARCVSDDEVLMAVERLEQLAKDYDFGPAWYNLGELYAHGFEPGLEPAPLRAAECYCRLLLHDQPAVGGEQLENAAKQLAALPHEVRMTPGIAADLAKIQAETLNTGVKAWISFALSPVRDMGTAPATGGAGYPEGPDLRDPRAQIKEEAKKAVQQRQAEQARELEKKEQALKEEKAQQEAAARKELHEPIAAAEKARELAGGLKERGNDAYRMGALPGNRHGASQLAEALACYASACRVLEEAEREALAGPGRKDLLEELVLQPLKADRAVLCSNAAQVCLTQKQFEPATGWATTAADLGGREPKALARLAKAQLALGVTMKAAEVIDEALGKLSGRRISPEQQGLQKEFWVLAEEVEEKLQAAKEKPFKWSQRKPPPDPEITKWAEMEKRITANWQYQGGKYAIVVEQWGALVFKEESVKVSLERISMLRWRGDVPGIEGMYLVVEYDPNTDTVETEFIPPENLQEPDPEKQPKRHKFQASRAASPPPPATDLDPPKPAPEPKAAPQETKPVAAPAPAPEPELAADLPESLWVESPDPRCEALVGKYDRDGQYCGAPVYRKDGKFLYRRGGNWGVAQEVTDKALRAPFLVRSPDRGAAHPGELKRPRWVVKTPSGEEPASLSVAAAPGAAPDAVAPAPAPPQAAAPEAQGAAPAELRVSCEGSPVAGLYAKGAGLKFGRAWYFCDELQLFLWWNPTLAAWVLGEKVDDAIAPDRSLHARCRKDTPHPATGGWEVAESVVNQTLMLVFGSKTWVQARGFAVEDASAEAPALADAAPALAADSAPPAADTAPVPADAAPPAADSEPRWAAAEVVEAPACLTVLVRFVDALRSSDVDVEVGASSVRVVRTATGDTLEVPVGQSTDLESAKFSKKDRTLTLRLRPAHEDGLD